MPRPLITDDVVAQDLAAMKRMRKKGGFDWIKWTDDPDSCAAPTPRMRNALWSTLHDVKAPALAALPIEIRRRPLAGIEFSIDFHAKRAASPAAQAADLMRIYMLLCRRLAPWHGYALSTRTARSHARGKRDELVTRTGDPLLHVRSCPFVGIKRPMLIADTPVADTVYFGDRPADSWATLPPQEPGAQVRVYIKTIDNGTPIPRRQWRTRVEVTLNGGAIAHVLGALTVGDLCSSDYRKLVYAYLRLMSPIAAPGQMRIPDFAPGWLQCLVADKARHQAPRDARDALLDGNYTQLEYGLVEYRPIALLDSSLVATANGFRRSASRHARRLAV